MDFPLKRVLHAPVNGSAVANAFTDFKLPGSPSRLISRPMTPKSHEEGLSGGWIVQKFGGTSVGKFALGIAQDVVRAGLQDNRIAVVCSARSSSTKSEGTTNRLLRAAAEATKPHSEAYAQIIKAIEDDHIAAAKAVIRSEDLFQALSAAITAECKDLLRVLQSAQHLGEVSPSTEDKIVSKGEALSCRFLAALLQDNGVNAVFVDMSEVLKAHTGPSLPRLDETFYLDLARKLGDVVNAAVGEDIQCVPVVTGYFGRVPSGLLNSIGRGYTDLCAALVAVGLRAKELQVWKEVDGIFTADPRKVPTARLLDSVTPSEAAELTFYGSEVIHPFTMQQVIRASIPIRIKNVMNPRNKGTFIFPEPATAFQNSPFGSPSLQGSQRSISSSRILTIKRASSSNNIYPSRQRVKRPTAVTVKHKIVILNVHSNKRTRAHGFLMNIFKVLDKYHLTVDLISSSEVHVSMALHSEKELLSDPSSSDETPPSASLQPGLALDGFGEEEARELDIRDADLLGAVNELREFGTIDLVNNMAIVSLVGRQLRNMVGISGKFFKTLGDNNINIEMISQGASEINISCVIDEREADRALNVLHTSLFTFLD